MKVIYGEALGELVFARSERAQELAGLWRALSSASTWGDLRQSLPDSDYERLAGEHAEDTGAPPSDDEPVDADELPGVADGDFPPSVHDEHRAWMPAEVLALGHPERSALGGGWVAFLPADEAALVAALHAAGFAVERDDELVEAASGL